METETGLRTLGAQSTIFYSLLLTLHNFRLIHLYDFSLCTACLLVTLGQF